jgi:tetratricopeptide (TPR) repeat protein
MVSGRCEPAPSTDQYSLALSYVELRTGRLPYPELTAAAILKAKLDGTIDLSGLPEAEARVIAKALAVDPAKRWRTCAEFVREIRNSEKTEGSPRQHGRRPALAAAIIAAVAIAGAAGYATLRGFSSTPTREAAQSLEKVSRFADAGAMYASLYAAQPDTLASVLWDLQTRASDARRTGESVSLLRRLERLYAASPPPKVKGIGRWDVVNSLAWYLATDPSLGPAAAEESNRLAEEALRLAERDGTMIPQSLDTAAAAAARIGRFDEAVERIEKAIELADDAGARAEFERRRDAYRERRAWTEPQ